MSGDPSTRQKDSLRKSEVPPETTIIDNSRGRYPTEAWEATYFDVSHVGTLTARRVTVHLPAGLGAICPRVRVGQPGCIYAVRRWGFALRPSALDAAGFDPEALQPAGDDADVLRAILHAAAFDLPGEFIIASPEHPFRLVAPDGMLRGSSVWWRTYLGALTFFVTEGEVDADFIHLWAEAQESYHLAVDTCLTALHVLEGEK